MMPTFAEFTAEVKELLEPTAAGKGYNVTGVDGPNELYDFVHELVNGPGHALGEIVYKVRRYGSKRDPKDIAKIAAWAFLVWRKHHEGMATLRPGQIVEVSHDACA